MKGLFLIPKLSKSHLYDIGLYLKKLIVIKDFVKDLLNKEMIDVLVMQETEVCHDFDIDLLNIPGYILEAEQNDSEIRVATYIKKSIKYKRRCDLEGVNK